MKKQKLILYLFKWLAFMFFSFLTLKAGNSRIMPFILVGFIAVLLIWEGIKDFRIQSKAPDKN